MYSQSFKVSQQYLGRVNNSRLAVLIGGGVHSLAIAKSSASSFTHLWNSRYYAAFFCRYPHRFNRLLCWIGRSIGRLIRRKPVACYAKLNRDLDNLRKRLHSVVSEFKGSGRMADLKA